MFPSPNVAEAMVTLVTSERPQGWDRRSTATYYKPRFAREIQPDIDKQIESRKDLLYRYDIWCTDETRISPQTLYARINMASRYLVEKLDPTGKYAMWNAEAIVRRITGLGIRISVESHDHVPLSAEIVEPKEDAPKWKSELEDWLESESDEPFVKERLALTEDEVKQIKGQFVNMAGVIASVTPVSIRVVKMS